MRSRDECGTEGTQGPPGPHDVGPLHHEVDSRGAEFTQKVKVTEYAVPRRPGDGRRGEGTQRPRVPAVTGPRLHPVDGRGTEGAQESQDPAVVGPAGDQG